MISYAQNLEDVVLERAFRDKSDGFYIDIGAWHPDVDSVTRHFYEKGWRGINVEPVAAYFDLLVQARPRDINLRVAVTSAAGPTATFYECPETGLSGLAATTDRSGVVSAGFQTVETQVAICGLADITARHADRTVDFLKIDVEGGEHGVLESADWTSCRPRVVIVEAVAPLDGRPTWPAWEHLLDRAGYAFGLFDGLNRFYYRSEEPDLGVHLAAPANILDRFTTRREQLLQEEVGSLRRQLLAAQQDAVVARRRSAAASADADRLRRVLATSIVDARK